MILNAAALNDATFLLKHLNKSVLDDETVVLVPGLGFVHNPDNEFVLEIQGEPFIESINDLPLDAKIIRFTKFYKSDTPYEFVALKFYDELLGTDMWSITGRGARLNADELVRFVNRVEATPPVIEILARD